MTDIKRFTFRIPSDVYSEVEKIASRNRRSTTAEIIVAIEEYLQKINGETLFDESENNDI